MSLVVTRKSLRKPATSLTEIRSIGEYRRGSVVWMLCTPDNDSPYYMTWPVEVKKVFEGIDGVRVAEVMYCGRLGRRSFVTSLSNVWEYKTGFARYCSMHAHSALYREAVAESMRKFARYIGLPPSKLIRVLRPPHGKTCKGLLDA